MKKTFKKLITAIIIAAIAANSAISVSADVWHLKYEEDAETHLSESIPMQEFIFCFTPNKPITGIYEQCTDYESASSEYGNYSHIRYCGYGINPNGVPVAGHSFGTYFHYKTSSEKDISISHLINGDDGAAVFYVKYELNNTFSDAKINCNISGTIKQKEI